MLQTLRMNAATTASALPPPQRYALLFRGEAYRWGCDASGVRMQHAAAWSHVTYIVEPLETRGHIVRCYFVHDHRMCKTGYVVSDRALKVSGRNSSWRNASNLIYQPNSPEALDAIAQRMFGLNRVHLVKKAGYIKDQPDSIKKSIELFLQHVGRPGASAAAALPQQPQQKINLDATMSESERRSAKAAPVFAAAAAPYAFDYLIITRYDVRLLSPMPGWGCYDKPSQISVASKCEESAWKRFNCVADHFWIVPRPFVHRFTNLLGTRLNVSHYNKCCFSKRCIQKAGHGCYNVLGAAFGTDALGFCWPQPVKSVAEPNANYQCCRHGNAGVQLGVQTQDTRQ